MFCASAASVTRRVVSRRHTRACSSAGPLTSRASTRVSVRCAGSVRSPRPRGRAITTGPARSATVAMRPRAPVRDGVTRTSLRASSGQARAARTGALCPAACGPAPPARSDRPRPAAARSWRRCRSRDRPPPLRWPRMRWPRTGTPPRTRRLAASARSPCPRSHGRGPGWRRSHPCGSRSWRRAGRERRRCRCRQLAPGLDPGGDQRVHEEPGRDAITGRFQAAAARLAAGEVDLSGVLHRDDLPPGASSHSARGEGCHHLARCH